MRLFTIALGASLLGRIFESTVPQDRTQQPGQRSPRVRVSSESIPAFWRLYDEAKLATAAERFDRDYLHSGTVATAAIRAIGVSGRRLAAAVASHPRFYASIRKTTEELTSGPLEPAIDSIYSRLDAFVPKARRPAVFLVVGPMAFVGAVRPEGIVVAVELLARGELTDTTELDDWERRTLGSPTGLPFIVAHELTHFHQEGAGATLLSKALHEGAADFVAHRLSGLRPNADLHEFGAANEVSIWAEFQEEMAGWDVSRWLYQGRRNTGRPSDLGYFVGYRICEAYYERSVDKRTAMQRILRPGDAALFLRESGYSP